MKFLTVYCSSSSAIDPHFAETARLVGRELASRDVALVYGGGSTGLMGEVATACADAGGRVIGVITKHLSKLEVAFEVASEVTRIDAAHDTRRGPTTVG